MKALLRYRTVMGSRTIVAELGDADTARAIVNAHLALGEYGELVEEAPRMSIKDHVARGKKAKAKAAKLAVVPRVSNVEPFRKAKVRT